MRSKNVQTPRQIILLIFLAIVLVAPLAVFAQTTPELETEMNHWLRARDDDPVSYEAAWNLSRVLVDLGNRQERDEQKKDFYIRGVQAARDAVTLSPNDTWGHHYLAAALGKQALTEGGKAKIKISKEVRSEALKAIECDPENDRSHHVLGRWNREVANLGGFQKMAAKVIYGGVPKDASNDKAVEHFLEAIRINPTHILHHLELGKTYIKMSQYEMAIEEFETVLKLPNSYPNDPASKDEALIKIQVCKEKIEEHTEHWSAD